MRLNNKGFSMIELLLTITILGILMGVGMEAFSRYQKKAREQAVDTLAKSATQAAEQYLMDHPSAKKVTFEQLYDGNYINNITDPYGNGNCAGRIKITKEKQESSKKLAVNTYQVSLCCSSRYYTYKFPNGDRVEDPECKGVPYDIKKIQEVKVLNVYPNSSYANYFKNWMNSYGKGIIKVTPVSIEAFRNDPSTYLGTMGNWKYDVIVFGFADCNSNKDLSAASASLVDQFLENGGSAIFGHDTITIKGCGSHAYFNTLAKHVNIELGTAGYTATGSLKIVKRGIFTEYPWAIGDVGSPLTIKPSHVYGQIAHGDVWITFNLPAESDANRVYLSTYGTNAFIQTGHTTGSATEDEQKILANIVFYAKAIRFADDDDY